MFNHNEAEPRMVKDGQDVGLLTAKLKLEKFRLHFSRCANQKIWIVPMQYVNK